MHEKAIGTGRDVALARQWYERAAAKGNAKAMHNLAVLFAEGASGASGLRRGRGLVRPGSGTGRARQPVQPRRASGARPRHRGRSRPVLHLFAIAARSGDDDAAKKRDEVAGQLGSADLALAKAAADQWRPKPLDAGANEVALPPGGWDDAPTSQRKPLKPNRTS